ncbi:MAG: X-Pro dipeptidyl-peptidase [Verrucomicrobiales bacterium]|nr:X-Pro dipeptidyl-peptidase [Verrucomicrobiales bacterium]
MDAEVGGMNFVPAAFLKLCRRLQGAPPLTAALLTLGLTFPARSSAEGEGLAGIITEFSADRSVIEGAYTIPAAESTLTRQEALLKSWRERLEALPYDPLAPAARIDWHLLRNYLTSELADSKLQRARLAEMEPMLSFRRPLQDLLAARDARKEVNPEKAAEVLAKALTEVKEIRKKAGQGKEKDPPAEALKPSAVLAQRIAGALDELRRALAEWFQFYDGFQPDFGWWTRQPHGALAKELEDLSGFLRRDIAGLKGEPDDPLIGDPIGADALASQLSAECIPYSPAELVAIAEKEFAWCEGQMSQAATAMGCANGAEALAKTKERHAPPGGQPSVAVTEATKAIQFLKERDLVTIPPLAEETWRLGMIGAAQQKSMPYAVYGSPHMMIAYAHESMSQEEKMMSMRGNNAAFLHIVTPHELIPGHHLQLFQSRRFSPQRQLFRTPFLVEGWALHWEMLLWDLGYTATAEEKVGALFWRMHRCARIIVSLKFHLGEMKPAEMIDFLVQRVGHERSGATAEVRRYIGGGYSALYQAAYMLGGMQIRSLYQDLTGPAPSTGQPRLTPRQFHDAVLHEGAIPVEFIRAALTGQSLPRDWKSGWRFADGK